ncbi:MAG: hypothetical protein E7580_03790 [Ruminococcaceae bacterium]|nr:hypothetical protein [Oscillospiraceae bacterium]
MKANKKVRFEELYPIIEETLARGDRFSFCAFGVSMLPYIRNGKDVVTLGPVTDEYKPFDIIFYRRESGQFVLHRIVRVCSDGTFDLCGDNQFRIEKGIKREQIIAKLVGLERNGKNIDLSSAMTRIWCFFLPVRRFFLHLKSAAKYRIQKLIKK